MTGSTDGSSVSSASSLLTDALLDGRYQLGGLIGRGGMGVVYRGVDLRLDRPIAVKVLADAPGTHEARFRGEVRTLARFVHPNLVRLLDAGEHEGRLYLVMDLIEGRTLAACLREGSLPDEDVARVGADVASALAFVHGEGIVHRDVKPANILIDRSGCSHLADFGIARLVDTTTMTATGITLGTPAYLAPEQIQGGRVGPEADVYSLGLVLFECAAGRRAFTGTPTEVVAARLHRSPALPRGISPRLRETLAKMTTLEPERRISAAEVAERLSSDRQGRVGPVVVLPPGPPETDAVPTERLADALDETQLVMPAARGADLGQTAADPPGRRRLLQVGAAVGFATASVLGALWASGVFSSSPTNVPRVTGAKLPASTSTSSTTSTSTTLPSIAQRLSVVSSRIEAGVHRGTIKPAAAQQLLALLQPIAASPIASPSTDGQLNQVAEAYYGDVASGAIHGVRTLHALTVGLSALASAMQTSLPPANPSLATPSQTTGSSGTTGASGTSGPSGSTGGTGGSGTTGASGASGVTGSSGASGTSGPPVQPGPPGHGPGHGPGGGHD